MISNVIADLNKDFWRTFLESTFSLKLVEKSEEIK